MWRNLEPFEADTQAVVFVRQGVDVIVAFEDTVDQSGAGRRPRGCRTRPRSSSCIRPIRSVTGLTDSLVAPGGNITGVFGARDVVAKQLELYQLLVPKLHRVLTLVDPDGPETGADLLAQYTSAAARLQRPLSSTFAKRRRTQGPRARVSVAAARRGRRRLPPLVEPSTEPLGADPPARQAGRAFRSRRTARSGSSRARSSRTEPTWDRSDAPARAMSTASSEA